MANDEGWRSVELKVAFVTDLHGSRQALDWLSEQWRKNEAIIVGGDISLWGKSEDIQGFLSVIEQVGIPVYFVAGNHEKEPDAMPPAVKPLHGKRATLAGFEIGGLGGSNPTPFSTPFEQTDDEARRVLDSIGQLDILVSHAPPLSTKCDVTSAGRHIGSLPVREYVEKFKPMLVLCGHVHEAAAIDNIGSTQIVNPGPLMNGQYAALELGTRIRVELKSENFAR